jgi:pimeloyl-ACP methyl ester carboxylesterase
MKYFAAIAVLVLAICFSYSSASICGDTLCELDETKQSCPGDCDEATCDSSYNWWKIECWRNGWAHHAVMVDGIEREFLFKEPASGWSNGAICVMHGGGGSHGLFCFVDSKLLPSTAFPILALEQGFAVFLLNSTFNRGTDWAGRRIGKRWDCMATDLRENLEIQFFEKLLSETIPSMRPMDGNQSIFICGHSNGGYTTVLVSTYHNDRVTAFAPIGSADPYGTSFDMGTRLPSERECVPGVFRDNETLKTINQRGYAVSASYPNEKQWPVTTVGIPFKQFHHRGDGIQDISGMEKSQYMLELHGYDNKGAFIVEDTTRTAENHNWQHAYNQEILDFFKGQTADIRRLADPNPGMSLQVTPNPFSTNVDISVVSSEQRVVSKEKIVRIYDINGKLVHRTGPLTTHHSLLTAGYRWHAQDHPSGIYFVRVKASEKMLHRKIVKVE